MCSGSSDGNEYGASDSKDYTEPLNSTIAVISKEHDTVNDDACIIDPKSILKR
ncbi:MAG: hypothetical protein Q7J00_00985 [Synergistaceae bacterium]|nr:hypothetical protein [Synergistaceae bacterium]